MNNGRTSEFFIHLIISILKFGIYKTEPLSNPTFFLYIFVFFVFFFVEKWILDLRNKKKDGGVN